MLDMSKEKMPSGEHDIGSPSGDDFEQFFGFSKEELDSLLAKYGSCDFWLGQAD